MIESLSKSLTMNMLSKVIYLVRCFSLLFKRGDGLPLKQIQLENFENLKNCQCHSLCYFY
jgi:hypothetical protein